MMNLTTPQLDSVTIIAPASHIRYRVLRLIASLSMLTYLDRICIQRLQPDIQNALGLTDTEFGFVYSAFFVGYALFEMPVGWISDIWGTRAVILRIVLLWSLFTALTGAVVSFWRESSIWLPFPWGWVAVSWGLASLMLVRFLFGCGEAGIYPTLAIVARKWFPLTERAMVQGVILMSNRIGAAAAPPFVGWLSVMLGWRLAFVALGLVGVIWAVWFAFVYRENPSDHPEVNEQELALIGIASVAKLHGGPRLPWREAVCSPTVWAMGTLYVLGIAFGWTFYVTWLPKYLEDVYGLSFEDSELWIALPYLCAAAGCLFGGKLSDFILRRTGNVRWARSLVGMCGLAVAGLCFLTASMVHGPWQTVALFSFAFFASDMFLAPFWAAITDVGGRFTGTLAGFFNMMALLGAAAFASFIPWLRQHDLEWPRVLQIIALAWFIAAALWLIVDASKPLLSRDELHDPDA